jgi:molybdopterin synthase sulfur carrier subunit
MATILIPTPLRKYTNNLSKVTLQGGIIAEVIDNLITTYPDLQRHLMDSSGTVRPFVNIFVDKDDIRNLNAQNTIVNGSSVISIVPAIAGGNFKQ